MKFKIYKFNKVKSTNITAINLIKSKNKKFGYISADFQTDGKGTRGKKWISLEGNLFGSFFFPLNKKNPKFSEFAIINPILIADVISIFCGKQNMHLKFPNDILVSKKKICGILQEVIKFNGVSYLIIGIGINVVSSPILKSKYKTTNIYDESKKRPKVKEIVKLLIATYEKFFNEINSYDYMYFKKKSNLMVY